MANPLVQSLERFYAKVDEITPGQEGTGFNVDFRKRRYIRQFKVIVKDKRLGPIDVCYAPGIPLPYSFYFTKDGMEWDLYALCVNISAKRESSDNDWQNWIVTCEYSTDIPFSDIPVFPKTGGSPRGGGKKQEGDQHNPELQPPKIYWDWEIVHEAPARDLRGKPFLNSARQPFTPPPQFEYARRVLHVERNERAFDPNLAEEYAFAVNSDPFMDYEPGQAQCLPPKAEQIRYGPIFYHRVHYAIRFKPREARDDGSIDTWQPELLDQGLMRLPTPHNVAVGPNLPPGTPIPILRLGHPITQPVCLDGSGQPKQPNEAGEIEPEYLQFIIRKKKPFKRLFVRGLQSPLTGPGVNYWNLPDKDL